MYIGPHCRTFIVPCVSALEVSIVPTSRYPMDQTGADGRWRIPHRYAYASGFAVYWLCFVERVREIAVLTHIPSYRLHVMFRRHVLRERVQREPPLQRAAKFDKPAKFLNSTSRL